MPPLLRRRRPASRPRPSAGFGRGAFTLIELIVVMGLLAALAALSYSAIAGRGDQVGPRAAAGLVADLMRQARHTALSTGAPVEVVLRPESVGSSSGGWILEGVSHTILFSNLFEERLRWGTQSATFGFAGRGFYTDVDGNLDLGSDAFSRPRLLDNDDDGLVLECRVQPPAAVEDGGPSTASLLRLMDADGVVLELSLEPLGQGRKVTEIVNGVSTDLRVDGTWQLRVQAEGNIDDTDGNASVLPLRGGAWSRVQLILHDHELTLIRDGDVRSLVCDTNDNPVRWSLPARDLKAPFRILLGGPEQIPAIIDDVRILRTGVAERVRLPARISVSPSSGVRLLYDPSGRFAVDNLDPNGPDIHDLIFRAPGNRGRIATLSWDRQQPSIAESALDP